MSSQCIAEDAEADLPRDHTQGETALHLIALDDGSLVAVILPVQEAQHLDNWVLMLAMQLVVKR